jgi:hypothetical protein
LTRQEPVALQESALSQAPVDESPQAVPATLNPLSWQEPAAHASALTHAPSASPQAVPSATWLTRQKPVALQESALSQALLDGSPQAVPAGLNP